MKAIVVNQPGGAEQLQFQDFPIPKPQKGELLVKVKASAINRSDIIAREGISNYLATPILGI